MAILAIIGIAPAKTPFPQALVSNALQTSKMSAHPCGRKNANRAAFSNKALGGSRDRSARWLFEPAAQRGLDLREKIHKIY